MSKEDIIAFEGTLRAYEVISRGNYLMTTTRRESMIFPKGVTVYDSVEKLVYTGDGSSYGGYTGGGMATAVKHYNVRFARTTLTGYGGGDVDLPYVPLLESDVTQALPDYYGIDASADTVITGVQWQNGQVAPLGGLVVYVKVDGARSVVGTIAAGRRAGVFDTNIEIPAGSWVVFGFNAQSGEYPAPTVSAYFQTAGL